MMDHSLWRLEGNEMAEAAAATAAVAVAVVVVELG